VSQVMAFGQLRVLSGWHQGACVDLPAGAGEWSIGSEETNDVVLRDAPFAKARLRWDDSAWQLHMDSQSLELPIGHALVWDALRLVIAAPQTSWDPQQEQPWPHLSPTPESLELPSSDTESSEALAAASTASTEPVNSQAPKGTAAGDASWLRRMVQKRSMRLGLVGLVGMLTVAAVAAWTQLHDQTATALPPSISQEMPTPPPISHAQLQAVIQAAGLTDVVRIEKTNDQRHALWGVVQDQDQLESLLRDVMALTRKVTPHLLIQSEFEAHVQSLQSMLPPDTKITASAGGQVWLTNGQEDPSELLETIALVRRELPEAVKVSSGPVKLHPSAALPPAQVPGLPSILAFQSGPQAYVLLANGERILPGGQIRQWRLVSIENQALVLEDATGQTRRFER